MREHATNSALRNSESPKSIRVLDLRVKSPIHIGTREGRLGATEFVFESGRVYLVDENLLGLFLKERNLIDQFVMEVKKGPFQMGDFLEKFGKLKGQSDLERVCRISIQGGHQSMQDFRPFVRDGSGTVYIPGTSIKGVFRTAVLYRMLKQDTAALKAASSKIKADNPKEINRLRKFYSEEWLQKKNLQCFTLPSNRQGPNWDILRCLSVRDAYPLGQIRTQVIQIKFLSGSGDGTHYWSQDKRHPKDLAIWLEAVVDGTFRLELTWDNWLFEQFKINNQGRQFPLSGLDDLLDAVREMNSDLRKHEIDFYTPKASIQKSDGALAAAVVKRWYESAPGNLFRVGFGSGMLSTTVGLALSDELRQKIRDACGSGPRPGDPAPKSRRVWVRGQSEVLPLGWLLIQEADPSRMPLMPELAKIARAFATHGPGEKKDTGGSKVDDASCKGSQEAKPPSPIEIWEPAEVRWDRGKDEIIAMAQGKKATARGRDLCQDPSMRHFLEAQKKGKPFKAKVEVEVIGESYRKIVKVEPMG
jgi:CRISPR-associated protein Csm5